MDKHDATEQAYRNGYADGFADAKKSLLPCKMGDSVWGLRRYRDQRLLKYGKVSQMYYDNEMRLVVVMRNCCRGIWGKTIFATKEDALAELHGVERRVG